MVKYKQVSIFLFMSSIYGSIYDSVCAQDIYKKINLIYIYSITYLPNKNNIFKKCFFVVIHNDNRGWVCAAVTLRDFSTDRAFSCTVR